MAEPPGAGSEQFELVRPVDGFVAAGDTEAGVYRFGVGVDGVEGQEELPGDFTLSEALAEQAQDV